MRRFVIGTLGFACVAACGSTTAEPIDGDISITVGSDVIVPTAGAAIADTDATKLLVVIGTRDISCDTTLGTSLHKGTYASMRISREVATQTDAVVSVIRVESSGALINGATGEVVIDQLDGRVTGSVMFETQDEVDGTTVTLGVAGSFDVIDCVQ